MIKASGGGWKKRKKSFGLGKGFTASKSRAYRSIKQQLLHSGDSFRVSLKLKKRIKKTSQTKTLNFILRTRGGSYALLKTSQKRRAVGLNTPVLLDILVYRQQLIHFLLM